VAVGRSWDGREKKFVNDVVVRGKEYYETRADDDDSIIITEL